MTHSSVSLTRIDEAYPLHAASERLNRLHAGYREFAAAASRANGGRVLFDVVEWQAYAEAVLRAYRETVGQPALARRARVLECFAETAHIALVPDELVVGSQAFCAFHFPAAVAAELQTLGYGKGPGHIIHDYEALVTGGVQTLLDRIAHRRTEAMSASQAETLTAFERAARAFSRYIARHAEAARTVADGSTGVLADEWRARAVSLRHIAHAVPRTFAEGLQLVWFAQMFLHAENPSAAISFGRLDQYLWPLFRNDLETGALRVQDAEALLGAFFLKTCSGDESQNLTLGGVDAAGRDATNALSTMILRAMARLTLPQPSLSVRVHRDMPEDFFREACGLASRGTGQPGFVNDAAVVPALEALNIPAARARDYGIVGCYEAVTPGDSYPNTVGGSCTLPRELCAYMTTPAAQAAKDFEAFLEGWLECLAQGLARHVATDWQRCWNAWRDVAPSPFGSLLAQDCIQAAVPLEAGGARRSLFGINILGLGTAIDSLSCIRAMVFERHALMLEELTAAVAGNWPDETLRLRCAGSFARYGTDTGETNALVAHVSRRVADSVLALRMEEGVRPYPGFFLWSAENWDTGYATPDGRRAGEPISYGCGPSSACAAAPTAMLASAAHVAHDRCACGNPLAIALSPDHTDAESVCRQIGALVRGYASAGGFHLHVNLQTPETLRAAQAAPASYGQVMIRMSGLSARFVSLERKMQDALIHRAERGV